MLDQIGQVNTFGGTIYFAGDATIQQSVDEGDISIFDETPDSHKIYIDSRISSSYIKKENLS